MYLESGGSSPRKRLRKSCSDPREEDDTDESGGQCDSEESSCSADRFSKDEGYDLCIIRKPNSIQSSANPSPPSPNPPAVVVAPTEIPPNPNPNSPSLPLSSPVLPAMAMDLPQSNEELAGKKHPRSPLDSGEDCDEGSRHPKRHNHSHDRNGGEAEDAPRPLVLIPSVYVAPGAVDDEREEGEIFEDEEVPDYMVSDHLGVAAAEHREEQVMVPSCVVLENGSVMNDSDSCARKHDTVPVAACENPEELRGSSMRAFVSNDDERDERSDGPQLVDSDGLRKMDTKVIEGTIPRNRKEDGGWKLLHEVSGVSWSVVDNGKSSVSPEGNWGKGTLREQSPGHGKKHDEFHVVEHSMSCDIREGYHEPERQSYLANSSDIFVKRKTDPDPERRSLYKGEESWDVGAPVKDVESTKVRGGEWERSSSHSWRERLEGRHNSRDRNSENDIDRSGDYTRDRRRRDVTREKERDVMREKERDGERGRHRSMEHSGDREKCSEDREKEKHSGDRERCNGDREKEKRSGDRKRCSQDQGKEKQSEDRGKERERNRGRERGRSREHDRDNEKDTVRDHTRERGGSRERNRDSEKEMARTRDREWGRSRERNCDSEKEMVRTRDTERCRSRDRSRDRAKERDHGREERDRAKMRVRDETGDRARARELGDRDDDRGREMDRERDRERDRGSHRESDRGVSRQTERGGSRDRDDRRDTGHPKHGERSYQRDRSDAKESDRHKNDLNVEEPSSRKVEEDYQEKVEMQLAEQEEEDPEKIIEESRKRRLAILEKYKQQQSQQHLQPDNQQKEESPDESAEGALNILAQPKVMEEKHDSSDDTANISFSVGKSPPQNGASVPEKLAASGLGYGTPKSEKSADMFCDDIFGESPAGVRKPSKGEDIVVDRSGVHDNWDDAEGYYTYRLGEILDGRYEIMAAHGKGVFSTVVRAKDLKAGKGDPLEVAIKIIRNNDTMFKAGLEELVILNKLAGADPDDRRHCVRFLSSFKYRNHLCLVFESLHMNLREVLKKFGCNIGLKLTAVRAYAKQLFIALKHLRNCGVLHCDIKPDNMLVNEAKNVLKLCDFGNAMFAGKNEITPYLVSRFYRAPEIILGLPYDHPMDIWSVGCCLFELYIGKVLFPGPTNNDMLRLHMELKGHFPKKMLRKGAFTERHFDQDMNFHAIDEDHVTKKTIKRLLLNIKPKDIGALFTSFPEEDPKMLTHFKDLLERIFVLDPDKRITVSQALSHPFITGK